MTKVGWIVVIVVLLAMGGIGFAAFVVIQEQTTLVGTEPYPPFPGLADLTENRSGSDTGASASAETVPATPPTVTYTDTGFSPKSISVAIGDTVRFVNTSTHGMWIGVDDHPSHTEYDGTSTREHCTEGKNTNGSFDSCVAVAPGTAYNYTFTKAGTFGYHNHVKSSDTGTVVVK